MLLVQGNILVACDIINFYGPGTFMLMMIVQMISIDLKAYMVFNIFDIVPSL